MNNLKYFREESGVEIKQLARLLNVTAHTYLGFEQEKMGMPKEIEIMLAIIYCVDQVELFCEESLIRKDSIKRVQELSYYDKNTLFDLLSARLLGSNYIAVNYRTINKVKDKIRKSCE
jgi:DNA-binding XRE family transcriptional regulator